MNSFFFFFFFLNSNSFSFFRVISLKTHWCVNLFCERPKGRVEMSHGGRGRIFQEDPIRMQPECNTTSHTRSEKSCACHSRCHRTYLFIFFPPLQFRCAWFQAERLLSRHVAQECDITRRMRGVDGLRAGTQRVRCSCSCTSASNRAESMVSGDGGTAGALPGPRVVRWATDHQCCLFSIAACGPGAARCMRAKTMGAL